MSTGKSAFLGQGWAFPPTFSQGGKDVELVSDEDDIFQSLELLFSTNFKERFFHADFGCDLNRFMFQHMNGANKNELKRVVQDSITRYETRIDVEELTVENTDQAGKLAIRLFFRVRATNSRYNMVYPFYVNESAHLP